MLVLYILHTFNLENKRNLTIKKNYSVHLIAIIRNSSVERGKDNFPYHDFVL